MSHIGKQYQVIKSEGRTEPKDKTKTCVKKKRNTNDLQTQCRQQNKIQRHITLNIRESKTA